MNNEIFQVIPEKRLKPSALEAFLDNPHLRGPALRLLGLPPHPQVMAPKCFTEPAVRGVTEGPGTYQKQVPGACVLPCYFHQRPFLQKLL